MKKYLNKVSSDSKLMNRYQAELEFKNKIDSLIEKFENIKSKDARDYYNIGKMMGDEGLYKAARDAFFESLKLGIDKRLAWFSIATTYVFQKKISKALVFLEKCLKINPNDEQVAFLLDYWKTENTRLKIINKDLNNINFFIEESLRAKRENSLILNNIGVIEYLRRSFKISESCFRKSIHINPNHIPSKMNLGSLVFYDGRFKEGFSLLESRMEESNQKQYLHAGEYWNGKESLNHRTLFLHFDQGRGDIIQNLRFISELKKIYPESKITLEADSALFGLLEQMTECEFMKRVYGKGFGFPAVDEIFFLDSSSENYLENRISILRNLKNQFDFIFPLNSLPRIVIHDDNQIFSPKKYLFVQESFKRPGLSLDSYKNSGVLLVGLNWQGNVNHVHDKHRSLHLKDLVPFVETLKSKGVVLVSLQHGVHSRQIKSLGLEDVVLDLGSKILSFSDAAFVLSQLDHFLTIDSAYLHLAGALGVPTTALIGGCQDFRWGMKGIKSVWYNSVSLFRQKENWHWGEQLTSELVEFVASQCAVQLESGEFNMLTTH